MDQLSTTQIVFGIIGISGFIFVLIIYLSGLGLKEKFEQIGVRTGSIFEAIKNVFQGKRDFSTLSFKHFFEDLFYGILNFFGIYPNDPFHESIRQAIRALEEKTGSQKVVYRLPWYAMVGEELSGKSTLLGNLVLPTPITSPSLGRPDGHPLIQWWFYEKGIILDISGMAFAEDAAPSKSWDTFIKALRRYRPHRPLDGLILATPAHHFTGSSQLSRIEMVEKATHISNQLVKIEKDLGIRLPLYALITKSDEIGGFSGFVSSLPEKFHHEMFGWSNPYATTLSYNPKWIKEAFEIIYGYLFEGIIRIFGNEQKDNAYRNEVVAFPEALSAIEKNVGLYFNTIFKSGDYQDHFIFRGLYFTGMSQKNAALKKNGYPFLVDLFQKKIFGEVGIATPIKSFFLTMRKRINFLRFVIASTFLLSIYGLIQVNGYLSNTIDHIRPALQQVVKDLETEDWSEYVKTEDYTYTFQTKGKNLLHLLEKVFVHRLQTPFIPFSWISPTAYRLEGSTIHVYNRMIAANIGNAFAAKANLLTKSPIPAIPSEGSYKSPLETTEFLLLEGYVKGLLDLERNALLYMNLQETLDPFQLKEILQFLYGYSLNPALLKERKIRQTLIVEAPYENFDVSSYRLYAQQRLFLLYNSFLKKILNPEYNYALAQKLQNTLEQVEGKGHPSLESFKKSIGEIKQLMTFITQASGTWLSNPQFDPGSRYQKLVDDIHQIGILGTDVPQKLADTSQKMYQRAIQYLRSYGSSLTGYFLVVSPETKKLEPSPGLLTLEKQLDAFLEQSFMQKASGPTFVDKIPEDQFLHWDPQIIRNAVTLIESYKSFINNDLSTYPANLQDTLRQAGLAQTMKNIDTMLERAQNFYEEPTRSWTEQAEDARKARAMNIREVGPLFVKLLKNMDSVGGGSVYTRLRNLLLTQLYRTLQDLDRSLKEAGYYLPADPQFSAWNGEKGAIFKAYNLTDTEEMKDYFSNQSVRVLTMVTNNAEPVIDVLKSDLFELDIEQVKMISRWHSLVEQAIAYKKKKVNGSMKDLEKFMEDEGNSITYEACFSSLNPAMFNAESSDYFANKKHQLMKGMYKRCQEIASERGAVQYQKLAQFFNNYLSNAFPFIDQVPRTPQTQAEVSWPVMEELFAELEKLDPGVREALRNSKKYKGTWKDVEAFLNQLDSVKTFFQTYFAPIKKDGDPGLSFAVKFKQNRVKETFGNQVTDWALIFGDQSISIRQNGPGVGYGRWRMGSPVSFGFQWNVSSSLWPLTQSGNPALVKVNDRSLFVYEGIWSMLRAMMLHMATVGEGRPLNNDILFRFDVPLGPDQNGPPTAQGKLYLKIAAKTVKGQISNNFKIPTFPVKAPELKVEL